MTMSGWSGAGDGLDDMTIGAPRSAREALKAGAIGLEDLRAAHRLRDSRSALDVLVTLACFIAVPSLFGLYRAWWIAPLLMLGAIRNFNCAAQLVHESDHGTLFRSPRLNRSAGNLFAYLLGYTRAGHRTAHMDHHIYLNTERDPDVIFSQPWAGAAEIVRGLVSDLLLVSALKRLMQYSQLRPAGHSVYPWRKLTGRGLAKSLGSMFPVAVTQLLLLVVFTAAGGRWAYVLLHVVPIMTLYPLQIRVRSIAEHGFDTGYEPSSPSDTWMTRTSQLNLLERWIMAPFGQYLHYEHHVFPGVPNYNLRQVHRLLVASGVRIPTNRSYFGFIFSKLRKEWAGRTALHA